MPRTLGILIGSARPLGRSEIEEKRRACRAITQGPVALRDLEDQSLAELLAIPLFEECVELLGKTVEYDASRRTRVLPSDPHGPGDG